MKISEMLTWARSLGNISSSKAISHDDEDKSFNASYRDLYSRLLESNDDYVTKTVLITVTAGMAGLTPFEYFVPLPVDFYRLRSLDYQGAISVNMWMPMERFPVSSRADQTFEPEYRLDNNTLWIRGQNVSQIRLRYYPPPVALTHPDTDLQFATAITPNNFTLISSPGYAAWKNTGVYIYNVQNIAEGSIDDNTTGAPITLYAAGANLSNLIYYKGYLYWLQAGSIKRAPTDLVTPFVVGVVTTPVATGTVSSFSVFMNKLYYNDGGTMSSSNLDGTGPVVLLASPGSWLSLAGSVVFYIDATGALKAIGGGTLVASGVLALISDGTSLYYLDSLRQLHLATVSGAALGTDTVIRTDVTAIGPWAGNRIPILTGEGQQYLAVSSIPDSDVAYPLNVVTEIMSYQAAIDFRTKIGGEFDFGPLLARLGHPKGAENATGLWARFEQSVKRDDYKPERMNNSRRTYARNW